MPLMTPITNGLDDVIPSRGQTPGVGPVFDAAGLAEPHRYGPQPIAFFQSPRQHQHDQVQGPTGYVVYAPEEHGPFIPQGPEEPHQHQDYLNPILRAPSVGGHGSASVSPRPAAEEFRGVPLGPNEDGFDVTLSGRELRFTQQRRQEKNVQQRQAHLPGQGVFKASLPPLVATSAAPERPSVSRRRSSSAHGGGETQGYLFVPDRIITGRPQPRFDVPTYSAEFSIPLPSPPPRTATATPKTPSHPDSPFVLTPPHLSAWRLRLFHVTPVPIILSPTEYTTYFPHIDNVYSHRSTQRYKRVKAGLVSHYYDCRMKGRPPGTQKSTDPAVKKRRRLARERDLCDVKIKVTEYAKGMGMEEVEGIMRESVEGGGMGMGGEDEEIFPRHDVEVLMKEGFWTVQRVNGNGGQGGGGAGVEGPHRHSLEKSDEIKKNSVTRWLAAREKEEKKAQKAAANPDAVVVEMAAVEDEESDVDDGVIRPTGNAAVTAKRHSKPSDLILHSACFCPFSQRVWIALEAKGLHYQYCETDPFSKQTGASPRGLPSLRQGNWSLDDSTVILEYLEDLATGTPLLPIDTRLKAQCRFWINHINIHFGPALCALLHVPDYEFDDVSESNAINALQHSVALLTAAADTTGPFFLGSTLGIVDVHLAPFAIRLKRIMVPRRPRWGMVDLGPRWRAWMDAIEGNPHVQATICGEGFYERTVAEMEKGLMGRTWK